MNRAEELQWPEAPGAGPLGDDRWATLVYRPKSVAEVCEAVRQQAELGEAIYPQGGKTALDHGRPPGRPGAAIDLSGLNRVVDYPHADMTITVEPGITVSELRPILAENRQRLLIDVPQPDRATIGGAQATAAGGSRRFGLGRARDQIVGVSFVTSEGIEVKGGGRVVKNVAGYDFPKLLTGSMGTLGVITQMTLRVRPIADASGLLWIPVPNAEALEGWLAGLNSSTTRPVAVDALSPSAAREIGSGLGLEANGSTVLVIGFEDNADSVAWQIDQFGREIGGRDFEVLRDAQTEPLWSALTEFQAGESGPFSCVANLRPSRVVAYLEGLDSERWSAQAHAGNGVIHMRAIGEWTEDEAVEATDALRALAVRDGGNLIVDRCPTLWKNRLRVWGEPRGDWVLAAGIKRALDPKGLMNPGRFVVDLQPKIEAVRRRGEGLIK